MTISAQVIRRSTHAGCPDLFSVQARYPRFIHAETKTHRIMRVDDMQIEVMEEISLMNDPMLSRSASSSRAIPVERMIADVMDDPALPAAWGRNQRGMQAGDEIERKEEAIGMWLEARDRAVDAAWDAHKLGLHKQIVNRLLEPFGHISVIITATEWSNFFDLRRHEAADPTMRALADAIWEAMQASTARHVPRECWHTPYDNGNRPLVSAARCARVSYLNHDGTSPSVEKDLALADLLSTQRHLSPFEHVATPTPGERHANLTGWCSYRTMHLE